MTLIHFKNCTVLDTVAGALLPDHNVVVEGETRNFKLTIVDDLELAQALIQEVRA